MVAARVGEHALTLQLEADTITAARPSAPPTVTAAPPPSLPLAMPSLSGLDPRDTRDLRGVAEPEVSEVRRTRTYPRAVSPAVERYEVGEEIGRGGMGEVLAATDTQIGREVAIKRLHRNTPSGEQLARFLREARIQGRLEHPSIPPVHEVAVDAQGRPFFVMKKLTGTTLARALDDPHAFPRVRLLRAFVDVCNALDLAHSRSIIHRDIKPGNILLGEHGEVYVLDWGIACELEASEPPYIASVGTPGYMSPEQVRGDRVVDARSDVYALGCVLYEILTGRRLHPRGDTGRGVIHGVDARASLIASDVAPELDELCVRATALAPADRIASARELGAAVQRYLDGDRDEARRRELATAHLAEAHAALARGVGDDETRRRDAVRAAGRALALDPTLTGAAELVGRILFEPSSTTPRPVQSELRRLDVEIAQQQARFARGMAVAFLLGVPMLYMMGIHDLPYLGAYTGVATLMLVFAWIGTRATSMAYSGCTIASVLLLISLFGRIFSPFVVAPGTAAVALGLFALHPISRSRRGIVFVTLLTIGAVLAPWVAEATGLLSETVWKKGELLISRSPMDGSTGFASVPALVFFSIVLIGVAGVVSHMIAMRVYNSRRQVHLQAWHLRHLIDR